MLYTKMLKAMAEIDKFVLELGFKGKKKIIQTLKNSNKIISEFYEKLLQSLKNIAFYGIDKKVLMNVKLRPLPKS